MVTSRAVSESHNPGSLLDALGSDEWELRIELILLQWVVKDIRSDLFSRAFTCVAARLDEVSRKLDRHLKGDRIWGDMRMVRYVRSSLADVLELLRLSDFDEDVGVYNCRHSVRKGR